MKHVNLLLRLIEGKHDYEYALRKALRAVVELHKPDEKGEYCIYDSSEWEPVEYPCHTIKAIEKELTPQSALRHAYLMDTGGK